MHNTGEVILHFAAYHSMASMCTYQLSAAVMCQSRASGHLWGQVEGIVCPDGRLGQLLGRRGLWGCPKVWVRQSILHSDALAGVQCHHLPQQCQCILARLRSKNCSPGMLGP